MTSSGARGKRVKNISRSAMFNRLWPHLRGPLYDRLQHVLWWPLAERLGNE